MRALIITHGTRGDVQPYAALARALLDAGHEAVLAAPAGSAPLAEEHGIPFFPLDDGPNRMVDDPAILEAIETNYRGLRGKVVALRVMSRSKPLMGAVFADMAGLTAGGGDIVVHPPGVPGQHVAEALGVPSVVAPLQPGWVPTSAFRNPLIPVPLPRFLNRASYLPLKMMMRAFGGVADEVRAERLGLPKRPGRHDAMRRPDGRPATVLQAFSPSVVPGDPDFPQWVHTTGFWFLPAATDWSPSPELTAFLEAGPRPVYIGFGSMAGRNPRRIGEIVTEAVRQAGVRAVLVSGWGGIEVDELPPEILPQRDVPHDWLFPRMAAVVHHSGAGTTAAALAAGRPQVLCPFVADQPFWAGRVHAAGAAPAPQPQRRLSAEGLATAIRTAVTDPHIAERADALGRRVRAEDGVGGAVKVLESLV